jgi:hypothetical protein
MYLLTERQWQIIDWVAGSMAALILFVSFYLAVRGFNDVLPEPGKHWPPIKKCETILLVFWVCVPPAWFWFEYFFLFKRVTNPAPDDFEKLKYGQDLASKIWLAVVSALLMLYFGKDLRH